MHETGAPTGAPPHPRRPPGGDVPAGRGLDRPLPAGGWRLRAPSALPYRAVPAARRPWTADGLDAIRAAYGEAAVRAADAGVDVLLLDMADGYLLASFLSPLTNRRDDGDGEIPAATPSRCWRRCGRPGRPERPLAVRLVADDRFSGGLTAADGVAVARRLAGAGADLIDVPPATPFPTRPPTTGGCSTSAWPTVSATRPGLPSSPAAHITRLDEVNTILAAGRADLCRLDPGQYRRGAVL